MYLLSVLVLDGAGPVAVSVSKNNGHSTSDDGAARFTTLGSSDSDASNLPSSNNSEELSNNSEEPLPPEFHSAPVPIQVIILHSVVSTLSLNNWLIDWLFPNFQ